MNFHTINDLLLIRYDMVSHNFTHSLITTESISNESSRLVLIVYNLFQDLTTLPRIPRTLNKIKQAENTPKLSKSPYLYSSNFFYFMLMIGACGYSICS
jgi:hypothetical protein